MYKQRKTTKEKNKELVLDACCGKMMWFNSQDKRAIFADCRNEQMTLCDECRYTLDSVFQNRGDKK